LSFAAIDTGELIHEKKKFRFPILFQLDRFLNRFLKRTFVQKIHKFLFICFASIKISVYYPIRLKYILLYIVELLPLFKGVIYLSLRLYSYCEYLHFKISLMKLYYFYKRSYYKPLRKKYIEFLDDFESLELLFSSVETYG
jgi:hypothetical protein